MLNTVIRLALRYRGLVVMLSLVLLAVSVAVLATLRDRWTRGAV